MAESIEELKKRLTQYETNGVAKLFYSLNRKANEMADLLNKVNLANIALDDKNDKTFERLKIVWNDAASIATAVKALGETAGITNDEISDTTKPVFKKITTPESMADSVGELAGHRK